MPKFAIKQQCKMTKFEEFYSYLLGFVEELENDGLSVRMKKDHKQIILEKHLTFS